MKFPVTFTLTSCNRLDLLEKTIDSFMTINNYPISEYIISDDSGSLEFFKKLKQKLPKNFIILHNHERIGLSKSLDNLFKLSKNEFIFHCEDDWFFDGNPNFIVDSIEILTENSNIHQVNVRHEYDNPHKSNLEIFYTQKGTQYRLMNQTFVSSQNQIWNGYSWNPGLRRKSDYLKMFPDGIAHFGDEYKCCQHTKEFNYSSAILHNTSCYHLGNKKRTSNFII